MKYQFTLKSNMFINESVIMHNDSKNHGMKNALKLHEKYAGCARVSSFPFFKCPFRNSKRDW